MCRLAPSYLALDHTATERSGVTSHQLERVGKRRRSKGIRVYGCSVRPGKAFMWQPAKHHATPSDRVLRECVSTAEMLAGWGGGGGRSLTRRGPKRPCTEELLCMWVVSDTQSARLSLCPLTRAPTRNFPPPRRCNACVQTTRCSLTRRRVQWMDGFPAMVTFVCSLS